MRERGREEGRGGGGKEGGRERERGGGGGGGGRERGREGRDREREMTQWQQVEVLQYLCFVVS